MRKNILVPIMGVLIIGWTSPVMAEKAEWRAWPLGQRLIVGVSAYRPSLDTKVALTAGPIQGTIDFESNLGLEDTKSTALASLRWRFFKRHTLRADYFDLNRSGLGTAPVGVEICVDGEDCVELDPIKDVNAFVDVEALSLGYDYSIIFNEKMNWSVGVGLSLQDFSIGLLTEEPEPPNEPIEGRSKFTAPLPTLATTFNYAFTDKWILDLALNWLEIDLDLDNSGKFDGRILAFDAGVRWQTFKNVGFDLKYTYFNLDVDVDDGIDFAGAVEYKYRGPALGVNVYF
jgi:hypothetical protein